MVSNSIETKHQLPHSETTSNQCMMHKQLLNTVTSREARARTISMLSHEGSIASIFIERQDTKAEDNNTTNDDVTIRAADGGWSWVVMVAGFFNCVLLGFLFSSFSVFYVSLVDYFDSDHGETGWVGSLYAFTGNFLGVLIGALCKRYGSKIVAMSGCLVTAVGLLLSSLLISIPYLYITYGIIGGIGQGMVVLSTLILVPQYFDKRRALAISFTTTGFSVGGFITSPVTNAFLEEFGVSGAYVLSAGVWLHIAVCSSFYRSIELNNRIRKYSDKTSTKSKLRVEDTLNETPIETDVKSNTTKDNIQSTTQNGIHTAGQHDKNNMSNAQEPIVPNISSIPNTRQEIKHSEVEPAENDNCLVQLHDIKSPISACENKNSTIETKSSSIWSDLLNFSVLRNPEYVGFMFVSFFFNLGFFAFFVHYLSRMIHLDVPRQKAILSQTIMLLSMGIGRFVATFLATIRTINREVLFAVLILLIACVELSFPVARTFVPLLIYGIIHGLLGGGVSNLHMVVLVDICGIEHISKTTGFVSMTIAISMLIGIPLAGFIFDVTQSYDLPFYIAGSISLLSGIIMLALSGYRKRWWRRGKHPNHVVQYSQ